MAFKVKTLDYPALAEACSTLQSKVEASGFFPDLIIPIPNGGNRIADIMFATTKKASIIFQRPAKGGLKQKLKPLLKLMPQWLIDRIRILEAHHLVRRSSHMAKTSILFPEIDCTVSKVLFIDDAVDSGATLEAVMRNFREAYPEIEAKSAVITVTGRDVICMPDFYLYNDETLIRLPWSIDVIS